MQPFGPEYKRGTLSIEQEMPVGIKECDLGIQVSSDGRIWICVDGAALIRFKPILKEFSAKKLRSKISQRKEKS